MEKAFNDFLQVNPAAKLVVDYLKNSFYELNRKCSNYEPWQLILVSILGTYIVLRLLDFYRDLDNGLTDYIKKKLFNIAKKIPFLSAKIMQELAKTKKDLENEVIKMNKGNLYLEKLPPNGLNLEQFDELLKKYIEMNETDWSSGSLSGCVYGAENHLTELTASVYKKFAWSNPMHADVFPEVRKMEAEVVRMVCNLFNGDDETCGTMSSGGTESIMLACKAYRDLAYSKGIKRPEMIVPITAHAAFDKAADFFRIKIHHVPIDPKTQRVNAKKLKSYINSNTCMIVGSAPCFSIGSIDPIEDLSNLAVKYNIPLHVDACLGGFLIPFMKDAGFDLPLFDFRLPGVTSISCDTHKYGYTPKGSSVIMYRNTDYRKFQFFSAVEWPGGIYVSPTFAGSRAGSLIAMTWSTLVSIGHQGYVKITKDIIEATNFITDEIRNIKELKLMCEPDVSVVAFDSTEFNILNLLDDMAAKGWHLNALQNPTGIHIAVTKHHTKSGVKEKFIRDIKECVESIMAKPDRKLGKTAAIYCSTQGVPDKSLITDVAFLFLDECYNTKNKQITNVSSA